MDNDYSTMPNFRGDDSDFGRSFSPTPKKQKTDDDLSNLLRKLADDDKRKHWDPIVAANGIPAEKMELERDSEESSLGSNGVQSTSSGLDDGHGHGHGHGANKENNDNSTPMPSAISRTKLVTNGAPSDSSALVGSRSSAISSLWTSKSSATANGASENAAFAYPSSRSTEPSPMLSPMPSSPMSRSVSSPVLNNGNVKSNGEAETRYVKYIDLSTFTSLWTDESLGKLNAPTMTMKELEQQAMLAVSAVSDGLFAISFVIH